MATENVETLLESQTLWNLRSKREKCLEEKQKLKKRKKFQWTEEMVEYLLDSLRRYKVMCNFSGKDLDADKTFSTVNCEKEWQKI